MRLEIPAKTSILEVENLGLPAKWRQDESATPSIGNAGGAGGASLGLWVPCYIEPGERNLLLNSAQAEYASIALHLERHPFKFDPPLSMPTAVTRGGMTP